MLLLILLLQLGGQVIEVKTPLTHRDYSHLVEQEVRQTKSQAVANTDLRTPST